MKIDNIFFKRRYCTIPSLLFILLVSSTHASDYFVSVNDGNDSADGLSITSAWKTIQKAADTIEAGDTVYIKPGIYTELGREDGGSSSNSYLGIEPKHSGSENSVITYQGEEGVIINQNQQANGFYVEGKDYITIKGFEILEVKSGIVTKPKGNGSESTNIVIENNHMHHAYGNPGDNVSLVRLDSCKDCTVRNNLLHHAYIDGNINNEQNSAGILSYGMQNATLANNEIHTVNTGIFHKRFTNNGGTEGSLISNNKIHDIERGIRYSVAGSGDEGHLNQTIRFNFIYNAVYFCVGSDLYDTGSQSNNLAIYNNTFAGCGVGSNGFKNLEIYNNLFYKPLERAISTGRVGSGTGFPPSIFYSNHNIFFPEATFGLDLNVADHKYASVAEWQAVNQSFLGGFEANSPTLPPDADSFTDDPEVLSESLLDFRVKESSIAHANQANGRNGTGIGAYPTGTEVIGLLELNHPATITDLKLEE